MRSPVPERGSSGHRLNGWALTRRVVLAMIQAVVRWRAGLPPSTCCHTFRVLPAGTASSGDGDVVVVEAAGPSSPGASDRTAAPDRLTADLRAAPVRPSSRGASFRSSTCAPAGRAHRRPGPRPRCPGSVPSGAARAPQRRAASPGRLTVFIDGCIQLGEQVALVGVHPRFKGPYRPIPYAASRRRTRHPPRIGSDRQAAPGRDPTLATGSSSAKVLALNPAAVVRSPRRGSSSTRPTLG